MARIGLLHPGQMGLAVGCTLKNSGHDILWASQGRSVRTLERARAAGFEDVETLPALAKASTIILSVCPPEFASTLADEVAAASFQGLYADLNAVSPASKLRTAERLNAGGIQFVDGGIIGLPPLERQKTWLYLCGPEASQLAACFTAGPMEVELLGTELGKASALKMCYAGWNKGTTALSAVIFAAAQDMSVLEELKRAWERSGPQFDKLQGNLLRAAPKAWRWAGEMREIAATLEASGLPGGFHHAAEELYERLRPFKDQSGLELEDVLAGLS